MSTLKKTTTAAGNLVRMVILTLGTGGIGKTFFARLLAQFLLLKIAELGLPLRIYDADEEAKADLRRFIPRAKALKLVTREDIITLFQLVSGCDGITLADVKADRQAEFRASDTFSPRSISLLKRKGIQMVACIPVSAGKISSQATAFDWFTILGADCRYILVANDRDGRISWEDLRKDMTKFYELARPLEFRLPKLDEGLAREFDNRNKTVLQLLEAAGYPTEIGNQEPDEEEFGNYLSSGLNLFPVLDFWEAFEKEANQVFAQLMEPPR